MILGKKFKDLFEASPHLWEGYVYLKGKVKEGQIIYFNESKGKFEVKDGISKRETKT